MKPPSREDITAWLKECWDDISSKTIKAGFIKCGFREPDATVIGSDLEDQEDIEDQGDLIQALVQLNIVDDAVGEVSDDMDLVDSMYSHARIQEEPIV